MLSFLVGIGRHPNVEVRKMKSQEQEEILQKGPILTALLTMVVKLCLKILQKDLMSPCKMNHL